MKIVDAAIDRSRMVLCTLLLLLVMGAYAWIDIPKESDPDINIPIIYTSMHLEGVSPSDAERLLIRPIEQELASIEGVKEMRSTSYQGGGNVLLEFQAGFDADTALDDVREAVDKAKSELPAEADEPTVNEVNFSLFPVLVVTLSGDVPERTLVKLARDLQDRIEAISTVLEAPIAGDREELVEIIIDPVLIESYGLNGGDIIAFFQRSNLLVAAGNLDTGAGRFAIKVPGLFESVRDIIDMPVRASEDSTIKLRDIGEVRKTFKDPDNFARLDGDKALAIEVVKRSGENIIDTIAMVKAVVGEETQRWPDAVKVSFSQDSSSNIRSMLSDLQNNMISAVLLVMIVIIAIMGIRAAGLVGIAIPGAFLTGILILYSMGLTVNVVVLFALILSVGMLVDGAIVVTEYADRKMAENIHRKEAYAMAAKRMAWPIIASTATTLAAFAPLLFWPGMPGQFMRYMPLTLIAVLSASLMMALIFVPTLGSLIGKAGTAANPESMKKLAASENGHLDDIGGFTGWYVNILRHALKYSGLILLSAVVLLVSVIFVYGKIGKGVEFFPDIEPERATVLIHARGNLSIYEQDVLVKEVEQRVLDVEGIETAYTRTGKAPGQGSDMAEDVIGQIQIEFLEWDERKSATKILAEINEKTANLAGIFVEAQKMKEGPPGGKALQVQLRAYDPADLPKAVEMVYRGMDEIGGFINIEDNRPLPGIEWELEVDRAQAAKFNIDIATIGNYVRMVTNGLKVAEYRPDDSEDEVDIVIRHSKDLRTINQLDNVRIETPNGSVPISNFVKRVAKPAVGSMYRVDQRSSVTIKADVAIPDGANEGAISNEKRAQMAKWLMKNAPAEVPNVRIKFKGDDEEQKNSQEFLVKAFGIALFLMAIILITQFNSFYSAALILTAVIMSTIGVMLGLLITGQPFGVIMSGVGVIALAGIIVNNNIVLIDTFDRLHKERGLSVYEAVLRTGAQRLRPVLMTTVTTVLGLLPMVMQVNIDFLGRDIQVGAPSTQWWVQLSTAVAFGLTFSTILTLIVTPSALMFKEQAAVFISKILK